MSYNNVRQNAFSDMYEGPNTILKKIDPVTNLIEIDKNVKKQAENISNK